MASAHDVAAYILSKRGRMTAMKLQKLVYYSQAWHLVWESKRLFPERISAWANGPVVKDLYARHRGRFHVEDWPKGDPANLTPDEQSSVDAVLEYYGEMTAHQLSELTHREAPWRDAREGLLPGDRGDVEITDSAMVEYYEALVGAAAE